MNRQRARLQPVKERASAPSGCLPGTRLDILQLIANWVLVQNPSHEGCNVFWLYGPAGSGKSTLATTVANRYCAGPEQLGAFLFLDRTSAERRDPTIVVRTLAYQLGRSDSRVGAAILKAIEENPDITGSPLRYQFLKLLIEPLNALDGSERPVVLVLDALDECDNSEERKQLFEVLANDTAKLPSIVRFFITGRTEYDIVTAFEQHSHILSHPLVVSSSSSHEDILLYLRDQMAKIRSEKKFLSLGTDWPGNHRIHQLADRASGLFIWAATAVRFIWGYNPEKRLEILLHAKTVDSEVELKLDVLYKTALESIGTWDDTDFVAEFRKVLGIILAAKNPLSPAAIDRLSHTSQDIIPSIHTISLLGCVLTQSPTVHVLHPSFANFLLDPRRCGRDIWFIDLAIHNCHLALRCLHVLDQTLQYNFRGLSLSSTGWNDGLTEEISYACNFWVKHVCAVKEEVASLTEPLDIFMFQHLLHWIEAMSILRRSRETIKSLKSLFIWATVRINSLYLAVLEFNFGSTESAARSKTPPRAHIRWLPIHTDFCRLDRTASITDLYKCFTIHSHYQCSI